jgi:hypothetical protein
MASGVATQLITVGATLAGVVLTLITNAYIEGRRARDIRELESLRLSAEHAKWLRDERMKAYAALSLAGEDALQFIRAVLPRLLDADEPDLRASVGSDWRQLRAELRKAYNQVALFGAEDARAAGLRVWRAARNGANDFLRDLDSSQDLTALQPELRERIRAVALHLGIAGDDMLEACRMDLVAR